MEPSKPKKPPHVMRQTPESAAEQRDFLMNLAAGGLTGGMLNKAMARVMYYLNNIEGALEEARYIELVRSLQFLVQTQNLIQDKPTSIVGSKDMGNKTDADLMEQIRLLQAEVDTQDKQPTIH